MGIGGCFSEAERILSLFIVIIVYFTQMTKARGVTPRKYLVILPSPKQVAFSEAGSTNSW